MRGWSTRVSVFSSTKAQTAKWALACFLREGGVIAKVFEGLRPQAYAKLRLWGAGAHLEGMRRERGEKT